MTLPSPDLLRELIDYDPTTGALKWKPREERHFRPGAVTGEWERIGGENG